MKLPDSIWSRLTTAAKARLRQAPATDDTAPLGFSTRVVALWREARAADRRLALWQRLSWRAAFASMAICGLIAIGQRTGGSAGTLLEPPALDLPGFDSPS